MNYYIQIITVDITKLIRLNLNSIKTNIIPLVTIDEFMK